MHNSILYGLPDSFLTRAWLANSEFFLSLSNSLSVILRIIFRSSTQMADTGWLPFTALRLEFRISDSNVLSSAFLNNLITGGLYFQLS